MTIRVIYVIIMIGMMKGRFHNFHWVTLWAEGVTLFYYQIALKKKGRFTIKHLINEEIKSERTLLVDGSETREMSTDEAISIARSDEMDLVQVSSKGNIAICKIMDYNKFLYEQKKKERSNNKVKQETKEIRLSDTIAENDIKTKAKNVSRMLHDGDKVRVVIIYKGRQISFIRRGIEKLNNFDTYIEAAHSIDREPRIEGNRVFMVLAPKNKA